ncbi:MAG: ABC-type hemin uptake system substrate-binding component HemT [Bacteroidetes bacterium HLUCCA01]|nr:MAG: ABC-type hemin uptake system substrate-binding component HemT [Bacteroidetes bacterium HLUCCA01]
MNQRSVYQANPAILFSMVLALLLFTVTQFTAAQTEITGTDGVRVSVADTSRIVSVGSAVTETIFALDAGDNLIAVDESSMYPGAAAGLPKVSFTRNLNAEGILSFSPGLVLASGAAGPETAIQQIRNTGTPLLMLPAGESVDAALERISVLGQVLGREEQARALSEAIRAELDTAAMLREQISNRPVVLFIYARGPNTLMVAGDQTSASTMIALAGGINAFSDFSGYKPLTPEAVVAANPDIILMMDSGLRSAGGRSAILQTPGIALTNAASNGRIHSMDGAYLLGFGPRLGRAVLDLIELLHPDAELSHEKASN